MSEHCRAGGGRAIKNEWWRAGGTAKRVHAAVCATAGAEQRVYIE